MMKRYAICLCLMVSVLWIAGVGSALAAEDVTVAVFSDPHVFDPNLGTKGPAFEIYLAQDRKLIRESVAILDAAIDGILEDMRVECVLVPGDLTKDGEKASHTLVAGKLRRLEENGVPVFVVPGNHDINNPHAFRYPYVDETTAVPPEPVDFVTPDAFESIYADFGYAEAIARDPASLSYLVEPVPGLWLMALDSCTYDENLTLGKPVTGGTFKAETLAWILDTAARGRALGKSLVAMMHHGITEHYAGQSVLFAEYVIEDWPTISEQFAAAGIQVVFTGHYHANDIATAAFAETAVTDVETGSLVTFPNPYRLVTFRSDGRVDIATRFVSDIDYDTGGIPFPLYAKGFLYEGLLGIVTATLTAPPASGGFGLDPDDPATWEAVQLVTAAFLAHYAGDETPTPDIMAVIQGLLGHPDPTMQLLGGQLHALWTDLEPADTGLTLDPATGLSIDGVTLCAALGDDRRPSRLDQDLFTFDGTAGETVTLRLMENPVERCSAERATLILVDRIRGTRLYEADRSALTNTVNVVLPSDGPYLVIVAEQPRWSRGTRYRGDYCLKLEGVESIWDTLTPTHWVE